MNKNGNQWLALKASLQSRTKFSMLKGTRIWWSNESHLKSYTLSRSQQCTVLYSISSAFVRDNKSSVWFLLLVISLTALFKTKRHCCLLFVPIPNVTFTGRWLRVEQKRTADKQQFDSNEASHDQIRQEQDSILWKRDDDGDGATILIYS